MNQTAVAHDTESPLVLDGLLPDCAKALAAAQQFLEAAKRAVAAKIAPGGKVEAALLEQEQFAAHGYAWLATYVSALEQMLHWAERL
ncbi:MAG: acyl-CoA dehydrogenase, partial [Kiloniellales bacterium]|nr:acyl-CoA dehydrogenase [Kiloniellales bacterium]